MTMLGGCILLIGMWFFAVFFYAFTFNQEKWSKNQEESRYTAEGDWRQRDIIKEYKDKIKEKVKKW